MQQNHKQHTILLADRIQDLGGNPAKGVGIGGKIAEVKSGVQNIGKTSTLSFLREIYDGENMGIELSTELVKGDLDSDSAVLINRILSEDKNNRDIIGGIINAHQ